MTTIEWRVPDLVEGSERDWRQGLIIEAAWRVAAPRLLRVHGHLASLEPRLAGYILDTVTTMLSTAAPVAADVAEALRSLHATPETAEEREAKLAEVVNTAHALRLLHEEDVVTITDLEGVAALQAVVHLLERALYDRLDRAEAEAARSTAESAAAAPTPAPVEAQPAPPPPKGTAKARGRVTISFETEPRFLEMAHATADRFGWTTQQACHALFLRGLADYASVLEDTVGATMVFQAINRVISPERWVEYELWQEHERQQALAQARENRTVTQPRADRPAHLRSRPQRKTAVS